MEEALIVLAFLAAFLFLFGPIIVGLFQMRREVAAYRAESEGARRRLRGTLEFERRAADLESRLEAAQAMISATDASDPLAPTTTPEIGTSPRAAKRPPSVAEAMNRR